MWMESSAINCVPQEHWNMISECWILDNASNKDLKQVASNMPNVVYTWDKPNDKIWSSSSQNTYEHIFHHQHDINLSSTFLTYRNREEQESQSDD